MSTLLFRGCYFRHCVIQDEEAGVFVRANMTADLSAPVCEEMGWTFGSNQKDGGLKGRLAGQAVILTPVDSKLAGHEMQSVCGEVADFAWAEVKDKGGQSTHRELRFQIRFPGAAAAFIANYKERVGKEPSQMKLTYSAEEQAELPGKDERQDSLPLNSQAPELDTGCIQCNNSIPFAAGSDDTHDSGAKCTRRREPALSSAREAAGGTHQAKRKGGQIADPAVNIQ